jgi:hypothetical protein
MPRQHQVITDLEMFIESHPTFVRDVLMTDFEFEKENPIEVGCLYEQEEECALRNCHHKHKKGFILKTKCGKFFNIGQNCGDTHFGVRLHEWTEGYEVAFKVKTQKTLLVSEPNRLLERLKGLTPRLLTVQKVNNFIWDNLKPLAKEAATKEKGARFRGLDFLRLKVNFKAKIPQIKDELLAIIAQVEQGAAESEDSRMALRKTLSLVKSKITAMEKYKSEIEDFFGSSPGLGQYEKGANLINIFRDFKCSSDSIIRDCDVKSIPATILIPSLNRRINTQGVFTY